MGCVPPVPGFLEGLRELTANDGALLVFDEVMTGFRVHPGGVQARWGVTPDLTTLGKVLGGGLPVGAYGGRREMMAHVAPLGAMYQAGTLSGNPLAMASGRTTLGLLKDHPEWYDQLAATTERLGLALRERFESAGIPVSVQWVCGMLSVFFLTPEQVARGILTNPVPVDSYEEAKRCDGEQFKQFFHSLLRQGIYLPPSAYEAWFLSTTHSSQQLSDTLTAVDRWIASL
jgi:glutamate-1-semialdehyde 2,1-aminomutase